MAKTKDIGILILTLGALGAYLTDTVQKNRRYHEMAELALRALHEQVDYSQKPRLVDYDNDRDLDVILREKTGEDLILYNHGREGYSFKENIEQKAQGGSE